MKANSSLAILVMAIGVLAHSPAFGGNVTVGTNGGTLGHHQVLNDWGGIEFDASTGNVSWGSNSDGSPGDLYVWEADNTSNGFTYTYAIEDYVGSGGIVGPRYGGQNYDAEFLGIGKDGNQLFIALVSGQRPDNQPDGTVTNGSKTYAPGDIYISTDMGVFGIEMTGQTYYLDGNGYTKTVFDHSDLNSPFKAGSIWKDPTWKLAQPNLSGTIGGVDYDANPALKKVQIEHAKKVDGQYVSNNNQFVGNAELYFSGNDLPGQHSIFEIAIDLSLFGGATIQGLHWSPSCGNDLLYPETDIVTTPEPATAGLLVLGAIIMGGFSRCRNRKQPIEDMAC